MEVVFCSIMLVFSMVVSGGIIGGDITNIKSNIIKVFILSWVFTIGFCISSFMLGDTTVELFHDVTQYKDVGFSEPKTIRVVTVRYPNYSVLSTNTTFTVIDKNEKH